MGSTFGLVWDTPFHLMLYLTLPVPHPAKFCAVATNVCVELAL